METEHSQEQSACCEKLTGGGDGTRLRRKGLERKEKQNRQEETFAGCRAGGGGEGLWGEVKKAGAARNYLI